MRARGLLIKNVTEADNDDYTCRAEVEAEGRYDERKISIVVHSTYITLLCFEVIYSGLHVSENCQTTKRCISISQCVGGRGAGLGKRMEKGGKGREGEVEGREREGPKLLLNQGPSEPCYATGHK